jgi:tetratricopeptide (TPR) repeat protein
MIRTAEKREGRRVLNPRALIIVSVILVVCIPGVRRLHSHQFEKTRSFLRTRALDAFHRGEISAADQLLSQYLSMKPSDVEVREKLSLLLTERVGTTQALERAFRLNEDLLRNNVPQNDLRLRQAKLAIRTHRYSDAEAHLKVLQSAMPDSSEVWYLNGVVAAEMRRAEQAKQCFRRAIRSPQPAPEAFSSLAAILEEEKEDPSAVAALYQQMVDSCEPAAAVQIRAQWYIRNKRFSDALEDIHAGLKQQPADAALNTMLVLCLQNTVPSAEAGKYTSEQKAVIDTAVEHFRRIQSEVTGDPRQLLNLAALLWHAGRANEAVKTLEEGVRNHPRRFQLHSTLAEYLLSEGRTEDARQICRAIPVELISRSEHDYLDGRILMAEEKWNDAVQRLERCIAFAAGQPDLLNRARIALAVSRRHTASSVLTEDAFREVLTQSPDSISGRTGMAAAWMASGKTDLAIAEYRQLLHVPGVPAYLASVLISHYLTVSDELRDWKFVEDLIREEDPRISDPVERLLLRADMHLARGEYLNALQLVEDGAVRFPNRHEAQSALRRLHGENSHDIRERLEEVYRQNPDNGGALAALVHLEAAGGDEKNARLRMIRVLDGAENATMTMSKESRLRLVQQTLNVLQRFRSGGESQRSDAIYLPVRIRCLTELAQQLPKLVEFLVQSGKTEEAVQWLRANSPGVTSEIRSRAWLSLVKFSSDRSQDVMRGTREVLGYIQQEPSNLNLRVAYAELLLYLPDYAVAAEILNQVTGADRGQSRARILRLWIGAVQGQQSEESVRDAISLLNQNPANHAVIGPCARILLASSQYEDVLKITEDVKDRDPAVSICRAAALNALNRREQAESELRAALTEVDAASLLPGDQLLLEQVRRDLRETFSTTAAR